MKTWKDECGVFGIWNHADSAKLTYLGLYAQQHRGQESCGIVTLDSNLDKKFYLENSHDLIY